MEDILVSIICNIYNHENYISDCLESFLMQKTAFKYEILVHDDASTDRTPEIVKNYESKYPDIIKPIYQTDNQYSKGKDILEINSKRAKGKYLALCEGDDYWTDPYKLQKQIDFLEKNPDYSACVHATHMVDSENKNIIMEIQPTLQSREICMEEIIEKGGGIVSTNSIVYRRNNGNIHPDFFYKNKFSFSDYQLLILLAMLGKVYYMNDFMSSYRMNVPGSWTARNLLDSEKAAKHIMDIISMLDLVNKETNYKYNDTIQKTKTYNEFNLFIQQGELKKAKSEAFKSNYKKLKKVRKIGLYLKYYMPHFYKFLSDKKIKSIKK